MHFEKMLYDAVSYPDIWQIAGVLGLITKL